MKYCIHMHPFALKTGQASLSAAINKKHGLLELAIVPTLFLPFHMQWKMDQKTFYIKMIKLYPGLATNACWWKLLRLLSTGHQSRWVFRYSETRASVTDSNTPRLTIIDQKQITVWLSHQMVSKVKIISYSDNVYYHWLLWLLARYLPSNLPDVYLQTISTYSLQNHLEV